MTTPIKKLVIIIFNSLLLIVLEVPITNGNTNNGSLVLREDKPDTGSFVNTIQRSSKKKTANNIIGTYPLESFIFFFSLKFPSMNQLTKSPIIDMLIMILPSVSPIQRVERKKIKIPLCKLVFNILI